MSDTADSMTDLIFEEYPELDDHPHTDPGDAPARWHLESLGAGGE